jgi:hypothetical protein
MITNTGKNILAKYLIGQAPAYASHIAVGCGPKPLLSLSCDIKKTSLLNNIATITTSKEGLVSPHGLSVGQKIIVSNSLKSNIDDVYLGKYTILSVPSPTTFTYALTGTDLTEETLSPVAKASVEFSDKTSLDFEMFRVPITSRGYVTEDGQSKIVFTAELPTAERYEITEVGVWSAGANPTAGAYDSKTIYLFNETDKWEYHNESGAVAIAQISTRLDSGSTPPDNVISTTNQVFKTNADNPTFTEASRLERYERCRFLNNVMVIRGDMSNLSLTNGVVGIPTGATHIHLTGESIDFNKNAPTDQLKLAFSVINKDGESATQPDEVRIAIEFSDTDEANATGAQYARLQVVLKETDEGVDFATNRYFVSSVALQDLLKTTGFTWNVVDTVKFYATVIKGTALVSNKSATSTVVTLTTSASHSFAVGDKIIVAGLGDSGRFDGTFEITEVTSTTIKYNKAGTAVSSTAVSPTIQIASPSDDYYVCLDALRLENITSSNPVYGLSGYSVIKNTNSETIVKNANTTNHIEFRFGMDVL